MGILTSDMTRLRGEISDLREMRGVLLEDLAHGAKGIKDAVDVMRIGFRNSLNEMAQHTKAERTAFISGLRSAVAVMRADFHKSHAEMAKHASAERAAFVSGLRTTVTSIRREFSTDLAGARRAWFGRASTERVTVVETLTAEEETGTAVKAQMTEAAEEIAEAVGEIAETESEMEGMPEIVEKTFEEEEKPGREAIWGKPAEASETLSPQKPRTKKGKK
jgi:hypothetical protein